MSISETIWRDAQNMRSRQYLWYTVNTCHYNIIWVRGISHLYWTLMQDLALLFFGGIFGLNTRFISRICTKRTKLWTKIKSNKNVSISPEFEPWTRTAGRLFEKIVYFHFRLKRVSSISDFLHRTRELMASVYGIGL